MAAARPKHCASLRVTRGKCLLTIRFVPERGGECGPSPVPEGIEETGPETGQLQREAGEQPLQDPPAAVSGAGP